MNKKLKIYSTLFVVVLIVLGVTKAFHYHKPTWCAYPDEKMEFVENPAEFLTCDTLDDGVIVTNQPPTVSFEVYIAPKIAHNKVLLSTSKDQTYRVNMQKVKLEVPASRANMFEFPMIFTLSSVVVIAVVLIWILCMVYKLIRSIRRGEIFVAQVSKYLETAGILLSVLYLFQWISSYILTQYFIKNIVLADYYVVFKNECNRMYIVTGFILVILSQIILMGKDLKEEQELTI